MKRIAISILAVVLTTAGWPGSAHAQTNRTSLNTVVSEVDFQQTPAHRAFEWLSVAAGFNLYINWNRMEAQGFSRETPVTMELSTVPAVTALRLLADEVFTEADVIIKINPSFVRIMTKQQANQNPVVKIYDIGDLLHEIPHFDQAPELDLNQIASDSDDASGGGIFGNNETEREPVPPRSERGQRIADAIRSNIEPDLWRANGGRAGQITYYEGRLVIRAPEYVHQKIGMPAVSTARSAVRSSRSAGHGVRSSAGYSHRTSYRRPYRHPSSRSNGVSGIDWR